MGLTVAVVGATGAVGTEMIRVLENRKFPVEKLVPLASRSGGRSVTLNGQEYAVQPLRTASFDGVDIALFSAGAARSKEFAPKAATAGAIVIDNSSAFRMNDDVPLIVPEVNGEKVNEHKRIIANPNCSTIQMVLVLKPIHDAARITRVIVTTYQAVSGAGAKASWELREETRAILNGQGYRRRVFPHQIAFNVLPQIPQKDAFLPNGYSEEEMKMVNETRKILDEPNLRISATTVRVPVFRGHSEAVTIETERRLSVRETREILANAPGIVVLDEPENGIYPMPVTAEGKYETFVGRIREDLSCDKGLNLWIVSDNLLKGAALNAVQIAELLLPTLKK